MARFLRAVVIGLALQVAVEAYCVKWVCWHDAGLGIYCANGWTRAKICVWVTVDPRCLYVGCGVANLRHMYGVGYRADTGQWRTFNQRV